MNDTDEHDRPRRAPSAFAEMGRPGNEAASFSDHAHAPRPRPAEGDHCQLRPRPRNLRHRLTEAADGTAAEGRAPAATGAHVLRSRSSRWAPQSTIRTVQIAITGTSAQLQKSLVDAGLVSTKSPEQIGDHFDQASTKASGGFSRIGRRRRLVFGPNNPISNALDAMKSKFDGADTKGQKFGQTMSTLGGATLLAGAASFGPWASVGQACRRIPVDRHLHAANANIPVSAAQKIGTAFLNTAGTTIFSGQQIATAYASVAGQLGAVRATP